MKLSLKEIKELLIKYDEDVGDMGELNSWFVGAHVFNAMLEYLKTDDKIDDKIYTKFIIDTEIDNKYRNIK